MSGVASGKLNHRVRIERDVYTQDAQTGAIVHNWQLVAEVWAGVAPLSARQYLQSAAAQSDISVRITVRYSDMYESGMRVLYRGKYYAIKAVLEDDFTGLEHITLMCSEGVRLEQ